MARLTPWTAAAAAAAALFSRPLAAQDWRGPVRGSWVRADEQARPGDAVLAVPGGGCEIVVGAGEPSAVRQAARFLAGDIERISGHRPPILAAPDGRRLPIRLATLGGGAAPPPALDAARLAGRWEAYEVRAAPDAVWLVGSDFRGTAYASYTLSERLGIDPLYLWTGYASVRHATLVLAGGDRFFDSPTFRFRGFFHDDEDILPRPFDAEGYPLQTGTVPKIWYERFFETALRLRLNMVAPYVRVQRPFEIQQMASDWGLFYTSHHYDILLSNPWGFARFGLAAVRHAGAQWDWFKNREGMMAFWRGGVLENRGLDCIWPVGLRGTQDAAYAFPPGTGIETKLRAYRDAIDAQIGLTKALLPAGRTPFFHFTLYTEMLDLYRQGRLDVPGDVIIVWPDDNDGIMRALPEHPDRWKHGVYYHLAYYTRYLYPTKQVTHTVSPMRIADQFRHIVDAGATEYMLVNVTELREYAMEARMLAEISWDAKGTLDGPAAADRYLRWWSREYFGGGAADQAAEAYRRFYSLLDGADKIWSGSTRVQEALTGLGEKLRGEHVSPLEPPDALESLQQRQRAFEQAFAVIAGAEGMMTADERRYFFENLTLGLLIDYRQTAAALLLARAMAEPDPAETKRLCFRAMDELSRLEEDLRRAERPPFEGWYRKTWIKSDESPSNVHRSYEHLRRFLAEHYPGG
ncbi:MAG TPA: glycosyl hydrolase 115 family protein [Opitutaceae bacterium]|nr:glycosyl hydrolase 115 family protein [Opitutaceae bacterium]